jgi:hypothetical protein
MIQILFVFFSFSVFAGIDLESSVVKITTKDPRAAYSLNGSGFLFKYREMALVLTSEHIFIPKKDSPAVTKMQTQDGKEYTLQLLRSDWGSGLALLYSPEKIQLDNLTDLMDFQPMFSPLFGQNVIAAGFPANSKGIVVDPNGTIADNDSRYELFLDTTSLYEVSNAMTEFGMSGGLLADTDLNPLGIISHKRTVPENRTYVIPMSKAWNWVKNIFDQAAFKAALIRASFAGENRDLIVRTGRFDVYYSDSSKDIRIDYFRSDEISIGNLFDHPFFQDGDRICTRLFHSRDRMYPRIDVYGFRPKGLANIFSRLESPTSLLDFFKKLRDTRFQPVGHATYQGSDLRFVSQETRDAMATAQRSYSNLPKKKEFLELDSELNYAMRLIGENSSWMDDEYRLERLSPHDIDFLLDDPKFTKDWALYRKKSSADTEKFRADFRKLRELMADYVL